MKRLPDPFPPPIFDDATIYKPAEDEQAVRYAESLKEETMGGHTKKEYLKISFDGSFYITTATDDANDALSSFGGFKEAMSVGDVVTVEMIEMTDAEYNALPDFDGF